MNKDKIIRRAEETARKLRCAVAVQTHPDPLYKEANKAIMSLLGVLGVKEATP